MTAPRATPEALRRALADLALVASGFVRGRGMVAARRNLLAAITRANAVLRAPGGPDLTDLAAAADAEARARPGFRADLEG